QYCELASGTVRRSVRRSALVAAIAVTAAGCGSSSGSSPSAGPTIRRAADVTAQAPGYKVSGHVTVSVNAAQHVVVPVSITGSFDRRDRVGAVTAVAHAAGREVRIRELISRLTLYMPATTVPNASTLIGSKRWIKLNISGAIPGGGLGSLSTATDPSQFVDYLRAVSSSTTNLGTATIGGVRTTHYHAGPTQGGGGQYQDARGRTGPPNDAIRCLDRQSPPRAQREACFRRVRVGRAR